MSGILRGTSSSAAACWEPGGTLLLSTHGSGSITRIADRLPAMDEGRSGARGGTQGFTVDRITGLVGPLAWTTLFRLLGYREALRRVPVLGPLVLPPLAVLMNVRMEIEDAITPATIRETNACVYVVIARAGH